MRTHTAVASPGDKLAAAAVLTLAGVLAVTGAPAAASRPTTSPVDSLLAGMTLPQKIGQLFTVYAYGADAPVDPAAAERTVGDAAHRRAAQGVTDRTVTAVRNDAGLPPYAGSGRSVLVTGWNSSIYDNVPALAGALAARGVSATALVTNLPTDAVVAQAVAAAGTNDLTVVLTSRAWDAVTADPGGRQQALVRALVATGRPVAVVAVRDPYDIAHLPGVTTYLTTYSFTAVAMESLAKVLLGVTAPRGKLPVSIPVAGGPTRELYPFGHGLKWRVP